MSDAPDDEPEGVWPFGPGGMDLGDVMRFLQSPGPVSWELAEQVATQLAAADPEGEAESRPDPPVDSARAAQLLELVRAAQTHVAAASGLAEAAAIDVRVVTRREWTAVTLDGLKPVLEALASSMASPFKTDSGSASPFAAGAPGLDDALERGELPPEMLGMVMGAVTPMMFGVQAGLLVGLLSQHALGQYDLPLPLAGAPPLAFVQSNIDGFARDWSLPTDALGFALALHEVVHAAQRAVGWVRDRLVRLSTEYVQGYDLQPETLLERFPNLDALDDFDPMEALRTGKVPDMPEIDVDPAALLAGMRTPRQEPILAELQRFGAVLGGYADVLIETSAGGLVAERERIDEALRRHRVEYGKAAEFVDSMLGLQIEREHYERGAAFCRGVVERAGLPGLNRLWEREAHVPTESELDAPGLWLARLDLDLD